MPQALPTLIQMLRSDDVGIHYEAVGVIGNLVHSSQHIKKTVLDVRPIMNPCFASVVPSAALSPWLPTRDVAQLQWTQQEHPIAQQ